MIKELAWLVLRGACVGILTALTVGIYVLAGGSVAAHLMP